MEQLYHSGYLSHAQQAYTLRRVTLAEGTARGTQIIEVVTADGLALDILPDAGLDIGQARYRGQNVSFICKNGYDSPLRAGREHGFLRSFPGGMLYTCGLRSTGGPHFDGDEWHPQHGRFHSLPAEQVSAYAEGETLIIRGMIRETALFGYHLELTRIIRIPIFGADVTVTDTLVNRGHAPEEYVLLYHCNFGWPLLSDTAELLLPAQRRTSPRNDDAAAGLGREHLCTAPIPVGTEPERVFFHEDMAHTVTLRNAAQGMQMTLTWSDTLPILAQWQNMIAGDYVLGLEPTNNYILGRKQERENGTLPVLAPGASTQTEVHFHFETI